LSKSQSGPADDRPRAFLNDRMRAIDREVTRRAARAVELSGVSGLSAAHGRVMAEVDPRGSRPTQIAERIGVTKAAVGQLITKLERRGMLERLPDPADGRAVIVRPTERALRAYRVARLEIVAIEDEWRGRLGARGLSLLTRSLSSLESWAREGTPAATRSAPTLPP
jgi:DNA-binding MarR family transcriptional regulator